MVLSRFVVFYDIISLRGIAIYCRSSLHAKRPLSFKFTGVLFWIDCGFRRGCLEGERRVNNIKIPNSPEASGQVRNLDEFEMFQCWNYIWC